jgi:phosphatidylglycerophosphate synthase
VTPEGTNWPLVLVWIGVVLAVAAAIEYVFRARREVVRSR